MAQHPKDVKFDLQDLADQLEVQPDACRASNFPATCEASAAYQMAKKNGSDDKMKDWFFVHQEEISPATVEARRRRHRPASRTSTRSIPKVIAAGQDGCVDRIVTRRELDAAFFVNGKRIPGGGMPPQYFEALIELELKRAK